MRLIVAIVFNLIICIWGALTSSLDEMTLIIWIQIVGNIVFLIFPKKKRYFSTGLVFYILLCLFHYGRLLTLNYYSFNIEYHILLESVKFSMVMLSSIAVGYLVVVTSIHKDFTTTSISIDDALLHKIRVISLWIIGITIIPLIYIDFIKIQYSFANGYVGINSLGEENAFVKYAGTFTTFTRPAVLLLILSYYRTQNKARNVLIAFCLFSLLEMLSGSRATSMIYIVASILLYIRLFGFRKSNLVILFLIIGATVFILPSITIVRQATYSVSDVIDATDELSAEAGQIESLLTEFGGTQISVAYALKFTDHFNFGKTYFVSLINISPKIPNFLLSTVSNDLTYTNSFPSEYSYTLGGSCIGEAYYNFGWLAPFFALLIGVFFGKVDEWLSLISHKNLYKAIALITGLPFLLLWVRGFFCSMVFPMFWVPILYRFFIKRVK